MSKLKTAQFTFHRDYTGNLCSDEDGRIIPRLEEVLPSSITCGTIYVRFFPSIRKGGGGPLELGQVAISVDSHSSSPETKSVVIYALDEEISEEIFEHFEGYIYYTERKPK